MILTKEEKQAKALAARESIQKDMGKGAVMLLSDAANSEEDIIPSGSIGLDLALGIGGWPRGRFVEVYGEPSSGKTTLAIHAMAEAQKQGELCAIIDAESAFDKEYAMALGVNVEDLTISQPENGEQGLEIACRLIESGAYAIIVIDSVAALVPKAEVEGEMGDNSMGLQARMMGKACRKMAAIAKKNNTLVFWINQMREKIGVMFGNPATTSGGKALGFFASIRADVTRSTSAANSTVENGIVSGNLTKVKIVKNKCAAPFRSCEFNIAYGEGIDKKAEIMKAAIELELIKKWGKTVTIFNEEGEHKIPLEEFNDLLDNNPEFYEDLTNKVKAKIYG